MIGTLREELTVVPYECDYHKRKRQEEAYISGYVNGELSQVQWGGRKLLDWSKQNGVDAGNNGN